MTAPLLKDKRALVTGATGGLGREIAAALARGGCNLFLTGRSTERLAALREELHRCNVQVETAVVDLASRTDVENLVAGVRKAWPQVDILVNCAGIFPVKSIEESSCEDFEECMNLNVRAPFLLAREFSRDMVHSGWGRIVNIGSSSAYGGFKETSLYCASKHALLGLSRAFHDELKRHNVRTFCISPGSIRTEMGRKVKNQKYETFMDPREVAEYIVFVISFDHELVSEEIRLNRMIVQ